MNEVLPDIYSDMGYVQRDMLMSELYFKCNAPEKGDQMMTDIADYLEDQLDYYASLDPGRRQMGFRMDLQHSITLLFKLSETPSQYERAELKSEERRVGKEGVGTCSTRW